VVDKTLIEQAKEKIGDATADIIADIFKLEKYDSKNKKGCCPFHNENTPSFIYSPKTRKYHCFGACNKSVDIVDAFMEGNNLTFNQAVAKVFELANMEVPMGEVGVKTEPSYKYPTEVVCTDKSQVYEYWAKRKISKATIDYCDVRQDEHGNTVFNYYDTNDVLCLVKYRPSRKIDKSKGDLKAWCQKGADTMPLLWNMNRINSTEALLIVEGEGDCMAAIESGYLNTVSVCFGAGNYTWIEKNFEWLEQFETILICSDNDEAGEKMRKELVYRLGSWRCKIVNVPKSCEYNGEKIKVKD
jgi:DNA primase